MQTSTRSSRWARAVGVHFAEGRLTITVASPKPFGKRTAAPTSVPVEENSPGQALAAWLESHLTPRQRRRVPVCIGLCPEQTFFTSRTVELPPEEAPTSETLLSLTGAGWADVNQVVADGVPVKIHGPMAYSIVACQRSVAEDFLQHLKACGAENTRLLSSPWVALVRAGGKGIPRGWKLYIRVVMTGAGGLAVLVSHGHPVLWRRFASVGEDCNDVISAIRHLQVHAKQILGIEEIAGVAVMGPMPPVQADQLNQETGPKVVVREGKPLDEAEYSQTLASWAVDKEEGSLDLFRPLRPLPTLREMFPRKLAAIMTAAIVVTGLFLQYTLSGLKKEHQALKRQSASHGWAVSLKSNELENERKQLKIEVGAVEEFLGNRVLWSNYLRDLPTRLPKNACLTNIHGAYELEDKNKKIRRRVNRALKLRGMARFANRGSAPKEIDAFLESLREMDMLKKDFPLVNLAEIKWRKEGDIEVALFLVVAMPK